MLDAKYSKQTIINSGCSLQKLFVAFSFCKFLCCSDNREFQSFLKKSCKSSKGTPFSRAVNLLRKCNKLMFLAGTEIYSILGLT